MVTEIDTGPGAIRRRPAATPVRPSGSAPKRESIDYAAIAAEEIRPHVGKLTLGAFVVGFVAGRILR